MHLNELQLKPHIHLIVVDQISPYRKTAVLKISLNKTLTNTNNYYY